MDETAQLLSLIGYIYDASLDPSLWPLVLGKAKGFVGGVAASLYSKDAVNKCGNMFYQNAGGIDPHYRDLYFDTYVKLDPTTTGHFFAELDAPVATNDIIPYQEFLETRFYREWARPQGFGGSRLRGDREVEHQRRLVRRLSPRTGWPRR